jgi:hypothetical protein
MGDKGNAGLVTNDRNGATYAHALVAHKSFQHRHRYADSFSKKSRAFDVDFTRGAFYSLSELRDKVG